MHLNKERLLSLLCIVLVTTVSFFTYFHNRDSYNKFIWDEHYHVASAQKYINHIVFMEPHPPFGKMLIAWGEQLLKYNDKNDQLLKKMKAEGADLPQKFSFAGYRFFPMLLAWLLAPLLFLVFKNITKSNLLAFCFSLFYAFDNAMIIHFRAAMLDSTLLFFMTLNLYLCLLIRDKIIASSSNSSFTKGNISTIIFTILLGVSFALILTTKVTGLINIIFPIYLIFLGYKHKFNFLKYILIFLIPFFITYFAVWEYHFANGTKIISSLDAKGYFIKNNEKIKNILDNKQGAKLANFFTMFKHNAFGFVKQYEAGVPKLNLCSEKENGSPFYMWPVGARAIQYVQSTQNQKTKYLYLQSNPVVWAIGLIGIIIGVSILIISCFDKLQIIDDNDKDVFIVLLLSYLGYMSAIGLINRVMYLYHYFPALLFSLFIAAMLIKNINKIFCFKVSKIFKISLISFLCILSIIAFFIYSPLTYYKEIPTNDISKLALNPAWDLKCPGCERTNHLANPIERKASDRVFEVNLQINDVDSFYVQQDWGEPKIGKSVVDKEVLLNNKKFGRIFGLHANSKVKYRLKGRYKSFSIGAGLPDYLQKEDGELGSVIFKILGDGRVLWQSNIMKSGDKAAFANVNVSNINILEIVMEGTSDGINYDHGVWVDPKLF